MNRLLILLGTALSLATAAHAQTVSNTYTSTDPWGTTTTTTIEGPAGIVGAIANQSVYGGYGGYSNYNGYTNYSYGVPNYGYVQPNYGYAQPNYGYVAPGYYPGQVYYVPGYNLPIGRSHFGWDQPPTITALPQVIVTPPVPAYPPYGYGYGGYGYGGYGHNHQAPYGYGSRTQIVQGGLTLGTRGLNVSIGGASVKSR